jgi:acyl carrier protein
MSAAAGDAPALLRAGLAERLGESDLGWLDATAPLAGQGIDSLDLIAVLARLQRQAGLSLPEDFGIDAETTLDSVAAALQPGRAAAQAGS